MGGGQSTPPSPEMRAKAPVINKHNTGDVVVIPVDASRQAETSFLWYVNHVHKPENQVRVIHCEELTYTPMLNEQASSAEAWDEMKNRAKQLSKNILGKYEEKLKESNIRGTTDGLSGGKPGELVVKAVEGYNASMVVMGTRGYGMVRRTILGSVSQYVIHHAKIPVTIIPHETTNWFF